MKKNIHRQWYLSLFLLFAALLLSSGAVSSAASAALADSAYALTVSDPLMSVASEDAQGCIHETLTGTGFTYSPVHLFGDDWTYNNDHTDHPITVSAEDVFPDAHGSFTTRIAICDLAGPGDISLDAFPKYVTRPTPPESSVIIHLMQPRPVLQAFSNRVSVGFGCATISLMGHGFQPSTLNTTNHVILKPSIGNLPANLVSTMVIGQALNSITVTGYRISVSGYGTIAASFPVCGLQAGETLAISAFEELPALPATPLTFQVVAFS